MKRVLILINKNYDLDSLAPAQIQTAVKDDLDSIYGKNVVSFTMNVQDKTVELNYQRSSNAYNGTQGKGLFIDSADLNIWLGEMTRCKLGFMVPYGSQYFNASYYEDDVRNLPNNFSFFNTLIINELKN